MSPTVKESKGVTVVDGNGRTLALNDTVRALRVIVDEDGNQLASPGELGTVVDVSGDWPTAVFEGGCTIVDPLFEVDKVLLS